MAFHKQCSPELIQQMLDTYAKLGSLRETGRQCGVNELTVRRYIRAQKALCERCTSSVPFGQRFCDDCNAKRAAWMSARRKQRRREGVCVECDERIQPPSIQFCDKHRLAHQERSRQHVGNKLRQACGDGLPTTREREKQIRYNYGQAGIEAWHRDRQSCVLCGVHYKDKTIHIHHIDEDHTHNVAENLVCLCLRCHRTIHLLVMHPAPHTVLQWFVAHYPQHLIAQLIQRGQSSPRKRRKAPTAEQPHLFPVS